MLFDVMDPTARRPEVGRTFEVLRVVERKMRGVGHPLVSEEAFSVWGMERL